jgi:hypothetical protein
LLLLVACSCFLWRGAASCGLLLLLVACCCLLWPVAASCGVLLLLVACCCFLWLVAASCGVLLLLVACCCFLCLGAALVTCFAVSDLVVLPAAFCCAGIFLLGSGFAVVAALVTCCSDCDLFSPCLRLLALPVAVPWVCSTMFHKSRVFHNVLQPCLGRGGRTPQKTAHIKTLKHKTQNKTKKMWRQQQQNGGGNSPRE